MTTPRDKARAAAAADPHLVASVLRERIYGGVACLSTLLVLLNSGEGGPWGAAVDVAIAAGSLYAASLLADHVSHLAAHGQRLTGSEALAAARASAQILEASAFPVVLLVVAGFGLLPYGTALQIAVWTSVATLGLFALLAARRTTLALGKQVLLVTTLLALGALVVGLKTLAH